MSKEDKMCMKLAKMEQSCGLYDRVELFYEKHYNHYGSRGFADLYTQSFEGAWRADKVYEVKGDAAIRNATGANEIVRQFNRMCKYFYAGVEHSYPPRGSVTPSAELTFIASELAFEHINDNYEIYKSLQGRTIDAAVGTVECGVTIRSLGEYTPPFIAFHDEFGLRGDTFSVRNNSEVIEDAGLDKSVVRP